MNNKQAERMKLQMVVSRLGVILQNSAREIMQFKTGMMETIEQNPDDKDFVEKMNEAMVRGDMILELLDDEMQAMAKIKKELA